MKHDDNVMNQLHDISTQLDGKISYYIISNSQGNKHKRIQIDYDFHTKSPLDIHPSDTNGS